MPAFKVTAIIAVRNEAVYLPIVLEHLKTQGIKVAILDHESNDDSLRIVQAYRPNPVERVDSLPYLGYFSLTQQLKAKERLRKQLDADWIIHQDADEILQPPSLDTTLYEAIHRAHIERFEVINFHEYVFVYENDQIDYRGQDFVAQMRHYYPFGFLRGSRLMRAFSNALNVDTVATGGHRFPDHSVRVYPESFVLRHYFALSYRHALQLYLNRRFCPREIARGWHKNRLQLRPEQLQAPPLAHLKTLPEHPRLALPVYDNPYPKHFWEWNFAHG